EDPRRAVLSRKDAALVREVDAGGVDQVDDRHPLAHGDLLGAEDLLYRFRPPRPRLHGSVVRHHDDRAAGDASEARDHAGGGGLAVVLVVRDQQTDLEPLAAGDEVGLLGTYDQYDGKGPVADKKSTRLNSSHASISYAVVGLQKRLRYRIRL